MIIFKSEMVDICRACDRKIDQSIDVRINGCENCFRIACEHGVSSEGGSATCTEGGCSRKPK